MGVELLRGCLCRVKMTQIICNS